MHIVICFFQIMLHLAFTVFPIFADKEKIRTVFTNKGGKAINKPRINVFERIVTEAVIAEAIYHEVGNIHKLLLDIGMRDIDIGIHEIIKISLFGVGVFRPVFTIP